VDVLDAGSGDYVALGAIGARFRVSAATTHGHYSIVEHPLAPGALVPPHRHEREDELMLVLRGEIGARIGDDILHAKVGEYVFKPRGIPHAFWNETDETAVIQHVLSPAGFESYFRELALLMPATGQPDFDEVARLAERYGVTFHLGWVPELEERFGVTVYGRGPLEAPP
jgi:quercetin dioxygenase-like cupin family protein